VVAAALGSALYACGGTLGDGKMAGEGGAGGEGGTTGAGGTTGTGGTTDDGGVAGHFGGLPMCPAATKGGVCTPTELQYCYKTCGPQAIGRKAETCSTAGVYVEMSGCTFDPAADYSCYKIPTAANAACPADALPQASAPCMIDPCVVCNSDGGPAGGVYFDSGGVMKVGFCVCSASTSKWSCASDTAWPCPGNPGC